MSKLWNQHAYADYKERQRRRRKLGLDRRSKDLNALIERKAEPRFTFLLSLCMFLAASAALAHVLFLRSIVVDFGQPRMAVLRMRGDVTATSGGVAHPLTTGTVIPIPCSIATGAEGWVDLGTPAKATQVSLHPSSRLEAEAFHPGRQPGDFHFDVTLETGSAVLDFRPPVQRGILHARTASGASVWAKYAWARLAADGPKERVSVGDGKVVVTTGPASVEVFRDGSLAWSATKPPEEAHFAEVIKEHWFW